MQKDKKVAEGKTEHELVDKSKSEVFGLKELIGIIIITAVVSFIMGFSIKQNNRTKSLSRYEEELLSNYEYILENYYKNIDARDLVGVAIRGMIDYLDDPYADYISTDNVDNFNIIIKGEYEGIGIQIGHNDKDEPTITYVFPNSSADINGLKIGDILIKVGETEVINKNLDEIKDLVGSFGDDEFKIVYKRMNEEHNTKLKRGKIAIESVEKKIYNKDDKKIGYLKLSNFATNSYEQFNEKLQELEEESISSLIVDLRNNTGGELESVDSIVSLFIPKDEVIYQMKEKDKVTKYYSKNDATRDYKIVVLVNKNSASASELMTGALKEMYGATIIGVNTFGKGTAQQVITLDNGERYKFTTREWLTANGNSIEGIGIEPTIKVEQSEEYYNNPIEENDKQLAEALKYLCQ
ncbi:MAG: S41 family peptidase [Bacilli bacterium]|nr:S41 family peptidase [Bacilli bacterium]